MRSRWMKGIHVSGDLAAAEDRCCCRRGCEWVESEEVAIGTGWWALWSCCCFCFCLQCWLRIEFRSGRFWLFPFGRIESSLESMLKDFLLVPVLELIGSGFCLRIGAEPEEAAIIKTSWRWNGNEVREGNVSFPNSSHHPSIRLFGILVLTLTIFH